MNIDRIDKAINKSNRNSRKLRRDYYNFFKGMTEIRQDGAKIDR
jgi:hypothetical protein